MAFVGPYYVTGKAFLYRMEWRYGPAAHRVLPTECESGKIEFSPFFCR